MCEEEEEVVALAPSSEDNEQASMRFSCNGNSGTISTDTTVSLL